MIEERREAAGAYLVNNEKDSTPTTKLLKDIQIFNSHSNKKSQVTKFQPTSQHNETRKSKDKEN